MQALSGDPPGGLSLGSNDETGGGGQKLGALVPTIVPFTSDCRKRLEDADKVKLLPSADAIQKNIPFKSKAKPLRSGWAKSLIWINLTPELHY